MIEISLDRRAAEPLCRQLAFQLQRMIENGTWSRGEKLPSTRDFASDLKLNRQTVSQAYALLEIRELVASRGRSGYYVACSTAESSGIRQPQVRWSLADDHPGGAMVPRAFLKAVGKKLFDSDAPFLSTPMAGLERLRRLLVRHAASRGIPARWQDVFVTSGGRQAMSLGLFSLRQAGVRRFWVPPLVWNGAAGTARAEGLQVCEWDRLPEDLVQNLHEPDCLFLIPSFANPTGTTMELALRRKIVNASLKNRFWILEDDAYGELRYGDESVPALRALGSGEREIYLGSFSQSLGPGLRLGYALVPEQLQTTFLDGMALRSGPSSTPMQLMMAELVEQGGLARTLTQLRGEAAGRMKSLVCRIETSASGIAV